MSEENKTKKKKIGWIVSIIIIILAIAGGAIGGAIFAKTFTRTEVDLSKYVTIEFDGYEGYASFDEEDLVVDQKGLKKLLDDKKLAKKLEEKLLAKAEVKENEALENGDVIEVKFKVSEDWLKENKIQLTSTTLKLKVKGLSEPDDVDLFEDLEFTYSGISPDLSVTLNNNSKDNFIKYNVTFQMAKDKDNSSYYYLYDIANGDKITVTATYDEKDLQNAGYTVSKKEYTFTVEGQPEYIMDDADFTSKVKESVEKKLLEQAKKSAADLNYDVTYAYREDFGDANYYDWNFTHTDPTLAKMYIAINKDQENVGWYDYRNIVFAIYKVTFTDTKTSKTYDYYLPVYTYDIIFDSDGLYTGTTYSYNKYYSSSDEYAFHKTADAVYQVFEDTNAAEYKIVEVK